MICDSMASAMSELNPQDFIITRKRKKYKFALFHNSPLCFEREQWQPGYAPTVLEVGAGTGKFCVALAADAPKTQHLAVDVKADRMQSGARLASEQGLDNVRFLRARIEQLAEVLKPHSLQSIWVTFPDPFPKERSEKHRLTHQKYLELYKNLLAKGGKLYFKTDAVGLFDWSLEQLSEMGWEITNLSFNLHHSTMPEVAKTLTTYEARYVDEGKKICYVEATPPTA